MKHPPGPLRLLPAWKEGYNQSEYGIGYWDNPYFLALDKNLPAHPSVIMNAALWWSGWWTHREQSLCGELTELRYKIDSVVHDIRENLDHFPSV